MNAAAKKKSWMLVLSLIMLIGTIAIGCASLGPQESLSSATQKPAVKTPVTITWLGYNVFKLTSGTKNVLIDPWIIQNPQCPIKIEDTYPVDIILISDSNREYVGDSIAIAKATGAKVVTTPEIAAKLQANGLPSQNILNEGSGINIGGDIESEGIRIIMTEAMHSSASGSSTGYIIMFPGGATVYYAGNTGIFSNMQIYGSLYPMHVALLPIGGFSTMDAYQASKSLSLLKPAITIPMRFGTFPNLAPDADTFVKLANQTASGTEVVVLKPGQSYILKPGVY